MRKTINITLAGLILAAAGVFGQIAPVDEPAVCYECHVDISDLSNKAHVHGAFESGKCSDCHNPHASKHAALLADNEADLCLSCHDDINSQLVGSSVHQPARSGECGKCHLPHASDFAAVLSQETTALCTSCHPQVSTWMEKEAVHAPVEGGECLTCHAAHGSANERLLSEQVPAICFDCHEQDQAFSSAHQGYKISNSNCATCHDPHAASLPKLLRPNQHSPFKGGKCTVCHVSSGGDSFAIKGTTTELCTKCHRAVSEFEKMPFHGHLKLEGSCTSCHNPHASATTSLLASRQEVLCMSCHFNATGEKEKAAYITHNGMDCSNCHTPHGSDNEKYLTSLDIELCSGCHEAAHKTSHPIGEDAIDSRTGQPLTCLGCHQLHGADFEKYLPLNPAMDLCIQCHKK